MAGFAAYGDVRLMAEDGVGEPAGLLLGGRDSRHGYGVLRERCYGQAVNGVRIVLHGAQTGCHYGWRVVGNLHYMAEIAGLVPEPALGLAAAHGDPFLRVARRRHRPVLRDLSRRLVGPIANLGGDDLGILCDISLHLFADEVADLLRRGVRRFVSDVLVKFQRVAGAAVFGVAYRGHVGAIVGGVEWTRVRGVLIRCR